MKTDGEGVADMAPAMIYGSISYIEAEERRKSLNDEKNLIALNEMRKEQGLPPVTSLEKRVAAHHSIVRAQKGFKSKAEDHDEPELKEDEWTDESADTGVVEGGRAAGTGAFEQMSRGAAEGGHKVTKFDLDDPDAEIQKTAAEAVHRKLPFGKKKEGESLVAHFKDFGETEEHSDEGDEWRKHELEDGDGIALTLAGHGARVRIKKHKEELAKKKREKDAAEGR